MSWSGFRSITQNSIGTPRRRCRCSAATEPHGGGDVLNNTPAKLGANSPRITRLQQEATPGPAVDAEIVRLPNDDERQPHDVYAVARSRGIANAADSRSPRPDGSTPTRVARGDHLARPRRPCAGRRGRVGHVNLADDQDRGGSDGRSGIAHVDEQSHLKRRRPRDPRIPHVYRAAGTAPYLRQYSVVDPVVGLLHAVAERDAGLPAQILLDQRVVAVAAVHALGGVRLYLRFELHAGDLLDDVDEAVDRHQLVRSRG